MTWIYVKHSRDVAIYALCPKCGFEHNPSYYNWATGQATIVKEFNYCPMCGKYLKDPNLELKGTVEYEELE